MKIKNFSILKQFIVTIILLFTIMIIGVVYTTNDTIEKNRKLKELTQLIHLADSISELLNETQKERGAGAGFIGSGGKKFASILEKQRKLTDEKIIIFKESFKNVNLPIILQKKTDISIGLLNKLPIIREKINNLKFSLIDELDFYTKIDNSLLEIVETYMDISKNFYLLKSIDSYTSFLRVKELVGLERGLMTAVISENKWEKGFYTKYISLMVNQKIYLDKSLSITDESIVKHYKKISKNEVFEKVKKIEKILKNNLDGDFGINSVDFYMLLTKKIDLLTEVDEKMNNYNFQLLNQKKYQIKKQLYTNVAVILFLLFIMFWLIYVAKKQIEKEVLYFLLNSQDNIIILNDGKKIESTNDAFFKFFDKFDSLKGFAKVHYCICDYFIKEEGYIYPFEDKNWVEYILENIDKEHKVKIEKNGKIFRFKILAKKIQNSEKFILTLTDITELEKEKEKIENLNIELNQYMDFIHKSSLVSKTDLDGVITFVNDKFCQTSGYIKKELLGKAHSLVRHPDTKKETFATLWETIKSGKIWKGEIKNRKKDGSAYYVKAMIAPIKDKDGEIKEYIAIRQNITKLVEAMEKAQEAEQAEMLFLSNMSHEIRTPLNGILGFTELLNRSVNIQGDERKYIETISSSGQTLLHIINDILDISKIKSGNIELEKKEFNLIKSLKETAELFKAKAKAKNINYKICIDLHLPLVVADEHRLKQIVANLIGNAIKFTPKEGKIIFCIEQISQLENYVKLKFSVKDSGIGIAKDKQKTIFKEFSQADNSVTREFGGTGLGLAISSKFVNVMGSELKIKSELEKGSEFYFEIDLQVSNKKIQLKDSISKLNAALFWRSRYLDNIQEILSKIINNIQKENDMNNLLNYDLIIVHKDDYDDSLFLLKDKLIIIGDTGDSISSIPEDFDSSDIFNILVEFLDKKTDVKSVITTSIENKYNAKVLIAEDNIVNQELLKALLDEIEIKYEIANDGVEAVGAFKKGKFDLIFMDVNMPNMSGVEAIEKIKEYEKQNNLKQTPTVMLTANSMQGDREKFLEIANDYLAKPIDSNELKRVLNRFLNQKNEIEEEKENTKLEKIEQFEYNKNDIAKSMGLPVVIFDKILKSFFDNIDEDMKQLQSDIQSGDMEKINASAHKVKGASSAIKLDRFSEIAQIIEENARQNINIDYKQFEELENILNNYKGNIK